MAKTTKRDKCRGCYDEVYHGDLAKECWSFEGAKAVKRAFIHIDDRPPWHSPLEDTLDCHKRWHYVTTKPDHPQLAKNVRGA